jgi:tRNA threonylcarbamoyladenosine biosynthesis protein TsaE
MHGHEIKLPDLAASEALATWLAPMLRVGDIVCLKGDLGSGKTTLVRFLLAALGVGDEVPSPTFNLVLTYETPDFEVWHFDLFRLRSAQEIYELGIEQAFEEAVSLIEWPERLGPLLPGDRLDIELAGEGRDRKARLQGHGALAARFARPPP